MQAYFDFVVDHRHPLEQGSYKTISARPRMTFKEPLTQEVIALNAPDLSKDLELQKDADEITVGLRKLDQDRK